MVSDLEKSKNFLVDGKHNASREHQSAQTHGAPAPKPAHARIPECAPDGGHERCSLTTLRASLDSVERLSGVNSQASSGRSHREGFHRAFGSMADTSGVLCFERIVGSHSDGGSC